MTGQAAAALRNVGRVSWRVALCLAVASFAAGGVARAAEDERAPQILTADLAQVEETQVSSKTVTFIIVGDAPIERVLINGQPEPFAFSDIVRIVKTFEFKQRQTVITIHAEDNEGHVRERSYVVNYGAAPLERHWSVRGGAELRYEVDENPTDDAGLPFSIPNYNIGGVIPPSKRPDNRSTAAGNIVATYGGFSVFAGGLQQQYEKQVNQGYNLSLAYGGAGYRFRINDSRDFLVNYVFGDLAVGNVDYAELHTLSAAFEFRSRDFTYQRRHLLGIDATYKDFAAKSQTGGTVGVLKWDYLRTQPVNLSTFNSVLQAGNSTEGAKLTDYDFISGDWDWHNRWEVGFRWDLGFGIQIRDYPNDSALLSQDLGRDRVDNLIRLSTGFGWQWNAHWSAMLNYRHVTDISTKAPYYRNIYGLTVTGGF